MRCKARLEVASLARTTCVKEVRTLVRQLVHGAQFTQLHLRTRRELWTVAALRGELVLGGGVVARLAPACYHGEKQRPL